MDPKTYKFDTLSLHGGPQPDKNFGSRAVPIYQTTSYVFQDTDHAAALFNLEQGGHIYSRISNPTVAVFGNSPKITCFGLLKPAIFALQ